LTRAAKLGLSAAVNVAALAKHPLAAPTESVLNSMICKVLQIEWLSRATGMALAYLGSTEFPD
jgi:hypothetical protein